LSGPGPYNGFEFEARLACFPIDDQAPRHFVPIGKLPCIFTRSTDGERRFSINVETGLFWSKDNPLDYGRALSEDEKRVKLVPLQAMVYWQPTRGVELGTGAGVFFFWSRQGLFDAFQRFGIEPMRVDVRPFDILIKDGRETWHARVFRSMTFRQSMVYFPKGFDAADFGSSVDSFRTPREVLLSMSMVFDMEAFFTK
jgi:hypothetical protein